MRNNVYRWKKKKKNLSKCSSCRSIHLLHLGQLCSRRSCPSVPCALAGAVLGDSPRPHRQGGCRLEGRVHRCGPSTSDTHSLPLSLSLILSLPKTRQMCALNINTAGKEMSHRANQYPAKDNGIPAQAAAPCPPRRHLPARAVGAGRRASRRAARCSGRSLAPRRLMVSLSPYVRTNNACSSDAGTGLASPSCFASVLPSAQCVRRGRREGGN